MRATEDADTLRPCAECGQPTASGFLSDDGVCDECWDKSAVTDDGSIWCPACGTDNYPIGILGTTYHYSCRRCGCSYSKEVRRG